MNRRLAARLAANEQPVLPCPCPCPTPAPSLISHITLIAGAPVEPTTLVPSGPLIVPSGPLTVEQRILAMVRDQSTYELEQVVRNLCSSVRCEVRGFKPLYPALVRLTVHQLIQSKQLSMDKYKRVGLPSASHSPPRPDQSEAADANDEA